MVFPAAAVLSGSFRERTACGPMVLQLVVQHGYHFGWGHGVSVEVGDLPPHLGVLIGRIIVGDDDASARLPAEVQGRVVLLA